MYLQDYFYGIGKLSYKKYFNSVYLTYDSIVVY